MQEPPFRHLHRRYNTLHFIPNEGPTPPQLSLIENLTTEQQEKVLTQELLYILSGVEASLITVHPVPPNKVGFIVDSRVELSLKELAQQVLQLAVHYHSVARYVENWCKLEHGRCNQALTAAIKDIIKDYFILLSQIEVLFSKDELSLQKLWFLIHPTLQVMTIVTSIVSDIEKNDLSGGDVLSLLHQKAASMVGDVVGQKLCLNLAEKTSRPYFDILESWIYKGQIQDPFCEFFVCDNKDSTKDGSSEQGDDYWENRYQCIAERFPPVFLRKVETEILKAGKYLNVIRVCGKDCDYKQGGQITYSIHERVYVNAIEKAYIFASKTLLDLLLNDYDLMRRIESLKHYLLMDQGDFIVQFMDLTKAELCKQIDDLNPVRLESLLELALRTSSSTTDPYKDCVKVQLFPYRIEEQMLNIMSINTPEEHLMMLDAGQNFSIPGFEGFSFSYEVQWPISLVINSRAITCYQMIFRHMFFCKHVERQLCKVWIDGKGAKAVYLKKDVYRAAILSVRQQMLNFVQNLLYYLAFEVIEPSWHTFLTSMSKVTNVDQVLSCHITFVNSILDDSMLTSQTLLKRMTKLLSICLQFSEKIIGTPDNKNKYPLHENVTVQCLNSQFNAELTEFLSDVTNIVQTPNQSTKVVNIIHRLNFNGYYTEQLEKFVTSPRLSLTNITLSY